MWGGDQTHKTTTSNISSYEQGIAASLLPATISDAIYVTHMLGFRWLWVDSLCIIQDSDADKRHEIGRMHDIYRYAHVTIMAASAERVTEGFLHNRSPPPSWTDDGDLHASGTITLPFICPPHPPTCVECRDDHSLANSQVGNVTFASFHSAVISYSDDLGCMGTRAWCLQEYLMSPRSLIFTPSTLQFRCLTTMQGVGNSLCATVSEPRLPITLFHPDPPVAESGSEEWKDMHKAWMEVVKDYSCRRASVESDKLVACAAVAEQFHRVLRVEYLAGLWRSDMLLTDLLWEIYQDGRRPSVYRAPSWSWAAVDGVVSRYLWIPELEDTRPSDLLAEIVECWVTLEDAALPFGGVTDGALVLRGMLMPCHGPRDSGERDDEYCICIALSSVDAPNQQREPGSPNADEDKTGPREREHPATVTMDCEAAGSEKGRMWVVPLVRTHSDLGVVLKGIILELDPALRGPETQREKVRFRRIGCFHSSITRGARGTSFEEHLLWDSNPLTRVMKDGHIPMMDIEIV